MKKTRFSIFLTLIIVLTFYLLNAFAQYQDYTQFSLPEGAKARLGKGYKTGSSIFSEDGTRFAVSSSIGLWIYDVFTAQEVALLRNHYPSEFNVLSVSPDGNMLASANENTISLWHIHTGLWIAHLTEHSENITTLVFSSDSKVLASASKDNTIRLWDATTGKLLFLPMKGHTGDVISIAFSPDNTMLASGSTDNTVRLWSVTTGEHLATLEEQIEWGTVTHEGHTGDVTAVAFSPDGTTLASGGTDNKIRLWDVSAREHRTAFTGHWDQLTALAFSKDGVILASGSADNTIQLWNTATGRHLDTLEGHENDVKVLTFSPDGATLASGDTNDIVRLWDGNTGQLLSKRSLGTSVYGDSIRAVTFSPDGLTLASGSGKSELRRYNYRTSGSCRFFYYRQTSTHLYSGIVRLWNTINGARHSSLYGGWPFARALAFSPDGTTLARAGERSFLTIDCRGSSVYTYTKSRGHRLQLWDTSTDELLFDFKGHSNQVSSVAFSPDGKILASGSWDDTIRLWNPTTRRHLTTLFGHDGDVNTLVFSPDGGTLVSGSADNTIKLWNSEGQVLATLYGHGNNVNSVAFSPDGQILASGSSDNTIRLWNPTTAKHITTLEGHTSGVSSVAFSIDGGTLASGSYDNTVRLWNSTTGEPLATLRGHRGSVYSVAFSPNGTTLASGSSDSTIILWKTELTVSKNPLDINEDGVVDILDLAAVVSKFNQTGENAEDVNGDGVVNVVDVLLVAGAMKSTAAAPSTHPKVFQTFTTENIQKWLSHAKQLKVTDASMQKGIAVLEQLLTMLRQVEAIPIKTALLSNYPNPFNPETWIPYQLASPADVNISIYAADGKLIRKLDLGHQPVGIYQDKSRAAYWDGKNDVGEPVTSGVYFYTLTADKFSVTRKMLILK